MNKMIKALFISLLSLGIISEGYSHKLMKTTQGAGTYRGQLTYTPSYGESRHDYVHWETAATIPIFTNENGAGDGITPTNTKTAIIAGAQAWQVVPTAYIGFVDSGFTQNTLNSTDGKNTIYWAEDGDPAFGVWLPDDPTLGVLGITIVTINSNQELLDVDIIMDGRDNRWDIDCDIQSAVTHELGHLLGIHHSDLDRYDLGVSCNNITDNYTPTMAPYYFGLLERSIEADDKEAVKFLYSGSTFTPPVAPTLNSPTNNSTNVLTGPIPISWSTVTGATSYYLEVFDDNSDHLIEKSGLTGTSIPWNSIQSWGGANTVITRNNYYVLYPNKTYTWRVTAYNNGIPGPASETRTFTTVSAGPTITWPTLDQQFQPRTFTLYWNAISGAQTYHLQIAQWCSMGTPSWTETLYVDDGNVSGTCKQITLPTGDYIWRVRSIDVPGDWTYIDEIQTLLVRTVIDANCIWYGNIGIPENTIINSGKKVILKDGTNMNIPSGVTLTVNGTIEIQGNISFTGGGTVLLNTNSTLITSSSLTIPAGVSLIANPGAVLNFASGVSLTVNGVLNAVGTSSQRITFTSNSPSSTWSGIFINGSGANNSVMEYCDVSKVLSYGGSAISVVNATGFALRHCNISNNVNYGTNGIYFSNAGSPEIYANTISSNGGYGVAFYNTNGNIYKNTLSSNSSGGVLCNYYASPSFGKNGFPAYNGNNLITGGSYGINASGYSYPYMGSQYNSYYGFNNVTGSLSARVYASGYCDVLAENNWWGSATPDPNWFQTYNNSTIDWYPALSYNPGGGAPKIVPSAIAETVTQTPLAKLGSGSPTDELLKAQIRSIMDLRAKLAFDGAKKILYELLSNADNIENAKYISPAMIALCRDRQDKQLLNACTQFLEKFGGKDPLLQLALAQIHIQNSRHSDAMSLLSQVASSNPNTEYEKYALLDQFYNAFSSSISIKDLGTLTDVLKNKYKDDPSVQQALWSYDPKVRSNLINPLQPGLSEKTVTQTRNETILVNSYPNPFNPSNVINYQLPNVGVSYFISLKVYDMLGRVVGTLVDGSREAGTYTANFDGSHLSSGIYFARFTATPQNGSKPFKQTMKMLLTK